MTRIYVIGSLRNPMVPVVADGLRAKGYDVFDDWYAAGPEADDYWQKYEIERGHKFNLALKGYHAKCVYEFDKKYLDKADGAVLLLPAGKSCHLELGYVIGQNKPGFIFMPDGEPERFDVMYRFARGVYYGMTDLVNALDKEFKSGYTGIYTSLVREGN